jgi:hypothetical protein
MNCCEYDIISLIIQGFVAFGENLKEMAKHLIIKDVKS